MMEYRKERTIFGEGKLVKHTDGKALPIFKEKIEAIKKTREWFTEELKKLGFKVLPSSANFVFASPKT